jgi:hypothetical protein
MNTSCSQESSIKMKSTRPLLGLEAQMEFPSKVPTSDDQAEDISTQNPKDKDDCNKKPTIVMTLKDEDVLGGRGAGVSSHPGNAYFRDLVKDRKIEYIETSEAYTKKRIAEQIVAHIIKDKGGRFLKLDKDDTWYCLSTAEAVKKTGQALRETRSNLNQTELNNMIIRKKNKVVEKQALEEPPLIQNQTLFNSPRIDNKNDLHHENFFMDPMHYSGNNTSNDTYIKNLATRLKYVTGKMNGLKREYDDLQDEYHSLFQRFMFEISSDETVNSRENFLNVSVAPSRIQNNVKRMKYY